ncbi:MAG: hypothetical protein KGJ63_10110 [Pseudomonadota bacterium]|nr:hypothetical protein [Pseudomonadota bacterium]
MDSVIENGKDEKDGDARIVRIGQGQSCGRKLQQCRKWLSSIPLVDFGGK